MTPAEFVERALWVPFKDRGRDWSGWDCYGLARAWFAHVEGVDLPAHDAGYETAGETAEDRAAIAALMDAARPAWRRVERPVRGNLLVMLIGGRAIHVGVIWDATLFLHAEKGLNTGLERLSSPIWARRIEGAYRYAAAR